MQKILIVEDDADMQIILKHYLSKQYVVQFNNNGQNIQTDITDFNPDLIVFDNKIGLTNAEEVLKELRASTIQIPPFILFSAIEIIAERAEMLGAINFISKPVNKEVLLRTIETSLAGI